ncbi:MAG: LytTR family DNA-binding domain-containing protein [Gemella haemolysans]|uniref:LytTR family DNA-binding domain-containing protein n=1 Tax=Gemella haemolysans TaxID=1379 RepID=UPI002911EA21|nr:LytTR family DNA-binding domain-containing protein [Gemella haemolysans]MDU6573436.1 LytTR family DNA-binding domain-containing protein [Gemella haemolysans]
MKVELNIDKKFGETIVTISTNKVNDEIQNLVNYIENKEDYFIGVLDGKVCLLNTEDIIRVYVEDRKVYVVTVEGRFIVRKKLYEVQSTLTKDFIKISQSEIANVKYIHSLDLGLRGTIVINYKNSDISYVSRRMLKEFKMKLGL